MTAEQQGPDERRIAHFLRQHGVGPDADPQPTIPPRPDHEPDPVAEDWWAVTDQPAPAPEPERAPVLVPSRILRPGEPMPGQAPAPRTQPAPAPPPPPRPPAPPAPAVPDDWWWRRPAPPAPPAVIPPMDIHIHIDPSAWLPAVPEPEPGPPWWIRWRPGYQTACIIAGLPLTGWWSDALAAVRDNAGLTGAWVLAAIPLGITAMADNVYRIAAAAAHEDLWPPKIRAFSARTLLWSTTLATGLALPLTTIVYWITGVPT
ncbi:hypothetical protein [Streptomyces hebeiensis]